MTAAAWFRGDPVLPRLVVEVEIEAEVKPTEDPEKVVRSVRQIFPDADVHQEGRMVLGRTASLDTLVRKAREERVMDAARGALWRGRLDEDSTRFEVNKQAAYVGRINFNEVTHPLGDLVVTVRTDDLNALLDELAPPTRAELNVDKTSEFRARVHREEHTLAKMGKAIETGFEDEPGPVDEDPWAHEQEPDREPGDDPQEEEKGEEGEEGDETEGGR